ncbi:MAG: C40 family peptidase [Coriobacteriia bacterium]
MFAVVLVLAIVAIVWYRHAESSPAPRSASASAAGPLEKMAAAADISRKPPTPSAHPSTQREHLLASAWELQGIPYVFGAKGPDTLDCSGFTKLAYEGIGVRLPDGSYNQAEGEQPLTSVGELVPGDLIFYRWANHTGVSHVTMYAGNGWIIGTGSPGEDRKVTVYPITNDLVDDGRTITYRHIRLSDERE